MRPRSAVAFPQVKGVSTSVYTSSRGGIPQYACGDGSVYKLSTLFDVAFPAGGVDYGALANACNFSSKSATWASISSPVQASIALMVFIPLSWSPVMLKQCSMLGEKP